MGVMASEALLGAGCDVMVLLLEGCLVTCVTVGAQIRRGFFQQSRQSGKVNLMAGVAGAFRRRLMCRSLFPEAVDPVAAQAEFRGFPDQVSRSVIAMGVMAGSAIEHGHRCMNCLAGPAVWIIILMAV